MPKSSGKYDQRIDLSENVEVSNAASGTTSEPIKYAQVVARTADTSVSKTSYRQQQTHTIGVTTNNNVQDKYKTKPTAPTTYSVNTQATTCHASYSRTLEHASPARTAMHKTDDAYQRSRYMSPLNKNPFKNTNLGPPMTTGNNYNNNNNNNNAGFSNRGNKPQLVNVAMQQQRAHKNYIAPSAAPAINMPKPTNIVMSGMGATTSGGHIQQTAAAAGGSGGVNNKKGRKKRKDSQKKLKQIEMENRSRSESLSSTHNNNNNYNKNTTTTTILNEKKFTILSSNNNATLLKSNNNKNDNNKVSFATIIKVNTEESSTTTNTQQMTDCNLSNHSRSSQNSLASCSTSTNSARNVDDIENMSPKKQHKIDNLSNKTSPAKSDKTSDYGGPTTDTDSETLTADSPEGYMRSHEIMEQYIKPKSSLKFAKELDQEIQINFLNSSLSACEEEDGASASPMPRRSRRENDKESVEDLQFGDLHENMNKQTQVTPVETKQTDNKSSQKEFIKYTLQRLRELENSTLSRKPPMVDCKHRESISHLFISSQNHHHKQTPIQYQHANFNESIDFLSKRRGVGIDVNKTYGLKKHHDHARDLHQRKMDVIRVQLLLKEEIKLSECENAWQPDMMRQRTKRRASPTEPQQDDLEGVLKKVRGVLNKLTPDNFDVLLKTMSSIIIDTQEKMQQVMLLVFEKTVSEPNFAPTYAKFFQILFQEIKGENFSNFNNALIKRIQTEFETNVNDADAKREKLQPLVDKMEACQDNKERLELQAEIQEREFQFRRRAWGTVRFIGEMYKLQCLTTDRVLLCLESLLKHGCEEKIEYMCKLLTTVGPMLESPKSERSEYTLRLDNIFSRTQDIINKTRSQKNQTKISSRVRFMMQDVIDLRGRNWDKQLTQQGKAKRGYQMDNSQIAASSMDQQRSNYAGQQQQQQQQSSYGGQQQQQRGRNQNKSGQHNMQHAGHAQQQQHQDNNTQKQQQNIDLNKLCFSTANDNTTLGNISTYVWGASTKITSTNNNYNSAPTTHAAATASRNMNLKSQSKTRPITTNASIEIPRSSGGSAIKTELNHKEILSRWVEEFMESNSNWQHEVLQQWRKISREQQISLLRYLLSDYLHLSQVKRAERQACSQIFMHLIRSQFEHCIFTEAYAQFGEDFPDLIVDVPNGWAYVFDFVGPLWYARLLDLSDIWLKVWNSEEQFTERFVKAMFDYYLNEFGKSYTRSLWQKLFDGEKAIALGCMEQVPRWLNYGLQQIEKQCTNIAGTTLSEQQQLQKQGVSINEQLKRIEYLLNVTENSDLAEDYIATNVYVTKSFLKNLTKFVCCEYAITTQMQMTTDKKNADTKNTATSSSSEKYLNERLFKQKCVPLLKTCLRGYEIKDFGMLDTIVHSLETMHDKSMSNELVWQIFTALYDCDMISKDAYDNWQQSTCTDTEQSMDDDETCSASSACDSLTDDLEAALTSANVEFIATAVQQQTLMEATTVTTQSRGRRRRNKHARHNVNRPHGGEVSCSASNSETSTATSPMHTPTGDNTSKPLIKNSSVNERLI